MPEFPNAALNHRPRHASCTCHRHLATTPNCQGLGRYHQAPYPLVRYTRQHLVTLADSRLIHHSISISHCLTYYVAIP